MKVEKFKVLLYLKKSEPDKTCLLYTSDSSKRSEELLDCQYPLMVRNYRDILDYASWLDCSDIFELSKLKITEKNGKLKGCLISEDRERVMQFLRETEVFDLSLIHI